MANGWRVGEERTVNKPKLTVPTNFAQATVRVDIFAGPVIYVDGLVESMIGEVVVR